MKRIRLLKKGVVIISGLTWGEASRLQEMHNNNLDMRLRRRRREVEIRAKNGVSIKSVALDAGEEFGIPVAIPQGMSLKGCLLRSPTAATR